MRNPTGLLLVVPAIAALLAACGGDGSPAESSSSEASSTSSSSSTSTPGGSGMGALRISEAVAKSDRPSFYDDSDWIELINTGTEAIELSDYALADSAGEAETLPSRTVQPGGYVVVIAGGDTVPTDAPYVTFGLGDEDSVMLMRGGAVVDQLDWLDGENNNGRSVGMFDGVRRTLYPTPGYDNVPYVLFSDSEVFTVRVDIGAAEWQDLLANAQDEQYYPANFELNGARIENVGFRTKGQGSLMFVQNSIRYGFKVDMNRYEDQKFMGMKMLVLNQSFSDPSFMRDVLSYKLMREAGMPAPQTSFVDLYVGDQHMGLYQLVEMLDSEFIEKHFPEDEDDKGDLYKGELGQRLTWVDNNIASYSSGLRLQNNEETQGTPEEGAALLAFLDGINNGSDPLSHIATDLTIRYLAALVLTGNMDSPTGGTANNFYLYEMRSRGVFTLLPWDFNLAYGMWGDGPAVSIGGGGFGGGGFGGGGASVSCEVETHVIDNPVHDRNPARPMFDAILANPQLRQQYHDTLAELLATAYDPAYIRSEIDRMAALIDPYVQADPTKFFTYAEWRQSLTEDLPADSDISAGRGANTYGPAPGLTRFIGTRADTVARQLSGELPVSNGGVGGACPP